MEFISNSKNGRDSNVSFQNDRTTAFKRKRQAQLNLIFDAR